MAFLHYTTDSSAANTPLRESHVACHMAPIRCASHATGLNQTR